VLFCGQREQKRHERSSLMSRASVCVIGVKILLPNIDAQCDANASVGFLAKVKKLLHKYYVAIFINRYFFSLPFFYH
jgi:hypothetical protein